MPCIDLNPHAPRQHHGMTALLGGVLLVALAGCATAPGDSAPASSHTTPAASTARASGSRLPAPAAARSWNDFKLQAARRMVAANPNGTYTGRPQQMLLAVPVLEIELNADGSVRNIDVMRQPSQARDTTQLAIDAVRRAAPYGDVSRLPKPWKFSETFLFNDDRRFKPRTLDAQ